ncbi:PIN domain-containing protein [Novilysobacter spongiicola]|uniref:NYN domain-containing protein n=1 Tax=Lysobacter spongiicola DSM 21749 TaxID=1122188 RepID=A0A1T4RIQ8_9GAMM|nr:PIN domain-containing protein [Lysobacter spongiicola]SKA15855.1 NYN domain-containing protein [Lysobacter spongiicola DSM 21749]
MSGDIFLIDFENVQPTSIGLLKPGACRIHVFVGQSQKSVPVELSQALQPFGPDACYTRIAGNGKNALDFHIAFYIGCLAHEHPGARFTIVSKDGGFDPLVKHLGTLGIACKRVAALPAAPKSTNGPVATRPKAKKAVAAAKKVPAKPKKVVFTLLPESEAKPGVELEATPRAPVGVDDVVARLKGMKAAKPAKLKTLQSSMLAWFKPALAIKDVDAIIQSLADRKKIKVDGTKVTYSLG